MERRGSVARKSYNLILLKSESATDSAYATTFPEFEVHIISPLRFKYVPHHFNENDKFYNLIFTSPRAVEHFQPSSKIFKNIFTTGKATTQAVKQAGYKFENIYEYPGGGQNLANKILENHPELTVPDLEGNDSDEMSSCMAGSMSGSMSRSMSGSMSRSMSGSISGLLPRNAPNCSFINPTVKHPHYGLAETLSEKINFVNLTVYESTRKSKDVLSRSIQGCFSTASNFIIYYSPKGTKAISPLDVKMLDPMITFGAIGSSTESSLEGWSRFAAEKPTAKSLRDCMETLKLF